MTEREHFPAKWTPVRVEKMRSSEKVEVLSDSVGTESTRPEFGAAPPAAAHRRDPWPAILAGLRGRCPACGKGRMFRAYLKVADACPSCGEELHHHRADDAPPYFTILVVGHVIGAMILLVEELWPESPIWLHALVWPTLVVVLSLWLLPLFKGALVAFQWALRMHGFEAAGRAAAPTLRTSRT